VDTKKLRQRFGCFAKQQPLMPTNIAVHACVYATPVGCYTAHWSARFIHGCVYTTCRPCVCNLHSCLCVCNACRLLRCALTLLGALLRQKAWKPGELVCVVHVCRGQWILVMDGCLLCYLSADFFGLLWIFYGTHAFRMGICMLLIKCTPQRCTESRHRKYIQNKW